MLQKISRDDIRQIPQDVLKYVTINYLPFREIYLIKDAYPNEYHERLTMNLNDEDMIKEPLLTALEFRDNNLMDLVIDELPKFHPDYLEIVESFVHEEEIDLEQIDYGDVLSNMYTLMLTNCDEDAVSLILATDGKTGNIRFDEWILNYERLDLLQVDDQNHMKVFLSDKVVSTIGDNISCIYGSFLIQYEMIYDESDPNYLGVVEAIYKLYRERGYIPIGILDATGWTEKELLEQLRYIKNHIINGSDSEEDEGDEEDEERLTETR